MLIPEGDWQPIGAGEVQYLRGPGGGGHRFRLATAPSGSLVLVVPPDTHTSAKRRSRAISEGLTALQGLPLTGDDALVWMVGWLKLRYDVDVKLGLDLDSTT